MFSKLSRILGLPLVLATASLLAPPAAPAQQPTPAAERPLILESIVLEGATRTRMETVLHEISLREGQAVTPAEILDAVADLRASGVFTSVDFRTSRGSERGRFVLHLLVEEQGIEFRFGTGYRDLDGWYLIPAQLRMDNRLGHGERWRLQVRAGYRVIGIEGIAEEPHFGDGRNSWKITWGAYEVERPYFIDGVEYRHALGRGAVGIHVARDLLGGNPGGLQFGGGWRFERVSPDSTAEAFADDAFRGIEEGDTLAFADLPASVASAVQDRRRSVFHLQMAHDSRSTRRRAATPVSGIWGQIRGEAFLYEDAITNHGAVTLDLRAYRAAAAGAFALRVRGGIIDEDAPFYDRMHLGGLYTVRGFPSQSLSPPGGDTRFWTASLEYRAPLAGRPDRPRLLGFLFADAGDGWVSGGHDAGDTAAAVGWGLRLRVPWFDSVGADFGVPVGPSPVSDAFHGNLALGWNF